MYVLRVHKVGLNKMKKGDTSSYDVVGSTGPT